LRIAESQTALGPALQRLAELQGGDEASRVYLRNIETHLQRLLTENEQGRSRSTADLRNDLRLLTRTVAALAEPQR
jgi:plasmid stabilization system protein ParE